MIRVRQLVLAVDRKTGDGLQNLAAVLRILQGSLDLDRQPPRLPIRAGFVRRIPEGSQPDRCDELLELVPQFPPGNRLLIVCLFVAHACLFL